MAVTALEIEKREPVLGGHAFGAAGAYEKIAGVAALRGRSRAARAPRRSPTSTAAPRNARGPRRVLGGLLPAPARRRARGNRRAAPRRAQPRPQDRARHVQQHAVRSPDPTTAEDFGNGFLMRHGYTVAWVGWQPDVPRRDGLMALDVAAWRAGVSGRVRCEWRPNLPGDVAAARRSLPHPVPDRRPRRPGRASSPCASTPARRRWRCRGIVAVRARDGRRLVADASHLHLAGGFAPGTIYDLIYRAQDPPRGRARASSPCATPRPGCAAGRRRRATRAPARSTAPTSSASRRAGASCATSSTSGSTRTRRAARCSTRSIPHVAGARRGEFNMRFGQPSLNARERRAACSRSPTSSSAIR